MIFVALIGIALSCYALMIVCDEFFVKSLDSISKKLKLSDDIAGATIMAVGTSAPEFFTALVALLNGGKAGLGAGTIIGSAIFNILCIAGGSALFLNSVLKKGPFLRDATFYTLFIFLILGTFRDGQIMWFEALTYLALYAIYLIYLKRDNKKNSKATDIEDVAEATKEIEEEIEKKLPFVQIIDKTIALTYPQKKNIQKQYYYTFWMSIVWIIFLSWVLVESAVVLAHSLGISEVIIGLTVLAAGTSIPDLLSSLIVAKQGRGDMAVANALGSNIFDIGICLGLPWIIYLAITQTPVAVKSSDLMVSVGTLLAVILLVVTVFLVTKFRINKWVGYIFIGTYIGYLCRAIITSI